MSGVLGEAVRLARDGDVDGAVALLRGDDAPRDDAHRSLLFQLLSAREKYREAADVCAEALRAAANDAARSTWTLRRGLCFLDAGDKSAAAKDLQAVVKLAAVDEHVERARKGLLEAAGVVKRMT
jgi:hypothetical protein